MSISNGGEYGITFGNNKFWIADANNNKVYAYSTTGTYDSSASFDLNSGNSEAYGITFVNNNFWVVDNSNDKVYAYKSGALTRSINVKIDIRSSTDTANTINTYLEANGDLSAANLTTAKVHMYKFSLPIS